MSTERVFNIQFIMVFAAEMLLQIGLYCIRPIIAPFAVVLGASLALAGLLSGLQSVVSMFVRPICGMVSDKYDKRMLLVASAALLAVSSFGCAFATTPLTIGVFEVTRGIAFTFKSALVIVVATLVTPKDRIGSALGYISLGFTIAGAIGPYISSCLIDSIGYSACYITAGSISLVGAALILAIKIPSSETQKTKSAEHPNAKHEALIQKLIYLPSIPFSLVAGIMGFAYGTPIALLFLIESMGYVDHATLYFAIYTVTVLISRPIGVRLCDRFGLVVAVPAILISLLGAIPLMFNGSDLSICIGAITMGAGQGPAFSILLAECMRGIAPDVMGRASNTFYLVVDLSMGICPLVGSIILDAIGCSAVFIANGIYLLLSLIGCILLVAYRKRRHEASRTR